MTYMELAALIDHTALKPETTLAQIEQLCREAMTHDFAAVCVNPVFVAVASRLLEGSKVKTCSVAGFPLGATTSATKAAEAREALRLGAREIDMVIWVGGLKAGNLVWVEEDVAELARICRGEGALLKVILECGLLTVEEMRKGCEICARSGAHFVKTSTGFGPSGAKVEDVRILSAMARPAGLGVKAAGGIRTLSDALAMIEAGATRIGTSSGVKIVEEARTKGNGS